MAGELELALYVFDVDRALEIARLLLHWKVLPQIPPEAGKVVTKWWAFLLWNKTSLLQEKKVMKHEED